MTDRTSMRIIRWAGALAGATALAASVLSFASGNAGFWWDANAVLMAVIAVCFAAFSWVIAPGQPRNATVWIMAVSACSSSLYVLGYAVAPLLVDDPSSLLAQTLIPAEQPSSVGWVLSVTAPWAVPGIYLPLTLGLLLFPDGRLPSRRWRPVAGLSLAAVAGVWAASAASYRPSNTGPPEEGPAIAVALVALAAATVLSLVSIVRSFRDSEGRTRQQFKWIVWGVSLCVPVFTIIAFLPDDVSQSPWTPPLSTLAAMVLLSSYGVAIGRYGLYEVDIVISRTVVFVSLAAFITGVYAVVAVGIGAALGGSDVWLSLLATALVAVAFEPVRGRVQRWSNRLVYGRRATPYEVLAELTGRLAATEWSGALLDRLAVQLRAATGAARALVWLEADGQLRPTAMAPDDAATPAPVARSELPGFAVAIAHEGHVLGALTVEEVPGVPLSPTGRQLVEDLAGSAALVVHKLRLDEALAAKAAELEESRRRLLQAQDSERRRLERELHDGVQQQVVALKVQLGLVHQIAVSEGADGAAGLIEGVSNETQQAVDEVRSLAQGIYPPLLDAEGLGAAIPALAAVCPLDVRVSVDVAERCPLEIEGAVYFCISEALTNASKHAADPVSVSVGRGADELGFTVTDSGPGFDVSTTPRGSGLDNMADRLDAQGGTLAIESTPGGTTAISGRVPLHQPAVV
jgi:signal transduction histidine kinase